MSVLLFTEVGELIVIAPAGAEATSGAVADTDITPVFLTVTVFGIATSVLIPVPPAIVTVSASSTCSAVPVPAAMLQELIVPPPAIVPQVLSPRKYVVALGVPVAESPNIGLNGSVLFTDTKFSGAATADIVLTPSFVIVIIFAAVDIPILLLGTSFTMLVNAAVSVNIISVLAPLATPVSVYTLGVALGGTAH